MRKLLTLTTTALFAATLALPAHAAPKRQDAPAPAADAAEPKAGKAKLYCVESSALGSRTRQKMCKTRADWIAEHDFDPLDPQR